MEELRRMAAGMFGDMVKAVVNVEQAGKHFVEFDSMINMRPSQGNTSRGVEYAQTRERILRVVAKRIQP